MRTVLITGATGTFGHAAIPVLLARGDRVICFSRDELKQSEMRRQFPDPRLEFFIGDVRDREALMEACAIGVDLLIHAAALKQVQTGQNFPNEVHKTNVGGALNVIQAARAKNVRRVVALSTDKAVAPINVYGKSKAEAEALFLAANVAAQRAHQRTTFVAVRYGNVIGSRGSAVPLFLEQAATGTLRVTDTRASRFWMPIDEAVATVLWAAERAPAGAVVVPKIPSALVVDVAKACAGADCTIEEIGLTPVEKLHEALISADEGPRTWDCGAQAPYYLILPDRQEIGAATRVPDGFTYTSDQSPQAVRLVAPCA